MAGGTVTEEVPFAPFLLEGTRVISYLTAGEFRRHFLKGYAAVNELWRNNKA